MLAQTTNMSPPMTDAKVHRQGHTWTARRDAELSGKAAKYDEAIPRLIQPI